MLDLVHHGLKKWASTLLFHELNPFSKSLTSSTTWPHAEFEGTERNLKYKGRDERVLEHSGRDKKRKTERKQY